MPKLNQNQFYCVKCNKRVTVKADDICVKIYKNYKMPGAKIPTHKAECQTCETNMIKFIKHDLTTKMQQKYGKC